MDAILPLDPVARSADLVRLWNGRAGDRFPLDARLWEQQLALDRSERTCLGAFADGRLAGFVLAKRPRRPGPDGRDPRSGNVSALAVDAADSGRGLGSALLAAAESWMAGRGAELFHFGRDPYHLLPGPPIDEAPGSRALLALLRSRGYELGGEEHDVAAELGALDWPALRAAYPLPSGWDVRPWSPALAESCGRFFRAEFPGRWRIDAEEALAAGMRPEDFLLLVESATDEVAGFARIYDARSPVLGPGVYWRAAMGGAPGGLGPIGVAAGRRGGGLGVALLREGLERLALRGVRTCAIDWTDLVGFYAKLGFSVWRTYRLASRKPGGESP